MQRGECKLCLKDGDLLDSHLLPAAVYRMCQDASGEVADPVGIRRDSKTSAFHVFQSSRQVTSHILCFDCEQALNVKGEDWTLPQLSTVGGFPLYQRLASVQPELVVGDTAAYAAVMIPDIRVDCLTHFALGIFWKAACHSWQTGYEVLRLEFGPYREKIKEFLLGGPFPQNAYLLVTIVPPSLPTISAGLPNSGKADGLAFHAFYVPGVEFMLALGNRAPDYVKGLCFVTNSSHPILVGPHPALNIGQKFAEAFQSGSISAKLASRLKRIPSRKA